MNTEEDEFKRIEREAKRRAQAAEDDDTQSYTSEAYRCGFEAGAAAEREACAKVCESHVRYPSRLHFAKVIRARGNNMSEDAPW